MQWWIQVNDTQRTRPYQNLTYLVNAEIAALRSR